MATKPRPLADRFWEKVDVGGPDKCWLWSACVNDYGYGMIGGDAKHNRGMLRAHRVAWELVNGAIPEGMCVLHRCDNPPCCNPKHLFLGTRASNLADMTRKGRRAHLAGGKNPSSKLTVEQVREIRCRYAAGDMQKNLATEYGVGQSTISYIVCWRTWRHLRSM